MAHYCNLRSPQEALQFISAARGSGGCCGSELARQQRARAKAHGVPCARSSAGSSSRSVGGGGGVSNRRRRALISYHHTSR